ncbi:hypothetical protein ACFVHB_07005 [Kitasatospora sp. NPDC127111]|uniref:hypothetical protein n=1 Tax=Kitasatospora sp. NPDC127111 TaxID=3345363 RepID=UPI00363BF0CC
MTPVPEAREPGPHGTEAQLLPTALLRRFPLRVSAHVQPTAAPDDLRVPLVADLLGRSCELLGGQALVVFVGPGRDDDRWAGFLHRAGLLGIHPPTAYGSVREVAEEVGGPATVRVAQRTAAGSDRDGDADGETQVLVAPLLPPDTAADATRPADRSEPSGPLDLRLALLTRRYDQPLALTDTAVDAARRTLVRWRSAMAVWAEEPSSPLPAATRHQARTAMAGLDTPALLDLLARTETDGTPGGAKFETFAFLDRLLGIGLASAIR